MKKMQEDVTACVGTAYAVFGERRVEWSNDLWVTCLREFSGATDHEGMVLQAGTTVPTMYDFVRIEQALFEKNACKYFWLPQMQDKFGDILSPDYTTAHGHADADINAPAFTCTAFTAWPGNRSSGQGPGIDWLSQFSARKNCLQAHSTFAGRSATLVDMMRVVMRGLSSTYERLQTGKPITLTVVEAIASGEDFDFGDFVPAGHDCANKHWVQITPGIPPIVDAGGIPPPHMTDCMPAPTHAKGALGGPPPSKGKVFFGGRAHG